MGIEIKKIILEDRYVHCQFKGTAGNLISMIKDTERIIKACKKANCLNALLDFREISGNVGIMSKHILGLHLASVVPRKSIIAVVGPAHLKETATGHLENVAVNRAVRLKVFWELEEAKAWLTNKH